MEMRRTWGQGAEVKTRRILFWFNLKKMLDGSLTFSSNAYNKIIVRHKIYKPNVDTKYL